MDEAEVGQALLTDALDAVLAGQPVEEGARSTRAAARSSSRSATQGAREDLVLRADRADADRQVRDLSPHRRHRPVADDQLRHDQGLRADDPRSRAHPAHAAVARRPALRRVAERPRADGRRDARRWCTGSKPARRAAQGPDPLAELQQDTGPSGRSASPTWSSRSRRTTCRRPASIEYQPTCVTNPLGRDVWVRAIDIHPGRAHGRPPHHRRRVRPEDRRRADAHDQGVRPVLGGYVPGIGRSLYPQDTGVLVREGPGASRSRCTTRRSGKPAHDVTRGRPLLPRLGSRSTSSSTVGAGESELRRFRRTRRSTPRRSRNSSRAT